MNLVKYIFLFMAVIGYTAIKAQDNPESAEVDSSAQKSSVPLTYNLSVGLYNYRGDVGYTRELGTVESFSPAFHAGAEYAVLSSLGIGVDLGYGSLVKNEIEKNSFRNFKSNIFSGGLRASFHFANGFILSENYPIDPFISVGLDFLSFTPKSDILDQDGNPYYYWQDGTIRDAPQGSPNANEIQRDHEYETEIPAIDQSKTALAYPVSAGFNFTINSYLKGQLQQSVILTNSDFIDGYVAGKAKDIVLYTSIGVIFNPSGLTKKDKEAKKEFKEIDFVALLKADSDADGVLDIDDKCQFTEEGVKVDNNGCPLDTDGDGIPDHLDKEVETPKNAITVDTNGVEIPDSVLAKNAQDTVVTLREELCQYYPSMCRGDETEIEFQILNTGSADKSLISSKVEPSKKPIDEIKKAVDLNGDGKVSSKEIYESIDRYFDGKSEVDLGDIHKLIDYYFEQ